MDYTLLALTVTLTVVVILRGRSGLGGAMLSIMGAYVLRSLSELVPYNWTWIIIILPINECLIQVLLYFFVFEMLRLRNKVQSNSFEEHKARQRRLRTIKWVVYSVLLVFDGLVGVAYRFYRAKYPQIVKEQEVVFDAIATSRVAIRVSLDLFMAINFSKVFLYILARKQEQQELTSFNRAVLVLVWVELSIFLTNSLLRNTLSFIFNTTFIPITRDNSPELALVQDCVPDVLDFFLYLGLLYLFDYQSTQQKEERMRDQSEFYSQLEQPLEAPNLLQ